MLAEIRDIPERALKCYERNKDHSLPLFAPHLGMGSSYFAALTLKYMGLPVLCEMASDYSLYLRDRKKEVAVLISQSGESSEVLWNMKQFDSYIAITNAPGSSLAMGGNCSQVINLCAGEETGSSTKTYVNSLVALYCAHGLDPLPEIDALGLSMDPLEQWGREAAGKIGGELKQNPRKGILVLGNGPDLATARQVALILSESIHLPVGAMSVAEFDHGPKEAIPNTILLAIDSAGPEKVRTQQLLELCRQHGGRVHAWQDASLDHQSSPITHCIPFFFLSSFLAGELGITRTFSIGGKVTKTGE